jgi:hypothetical protein
MKSKELIAILQELDPTGECQVYSEGDICDVIKLPWYYDGRQGIIVWKDKNFKTGDLNIIGLREHTVEDGDKIYIQCYTLDDAASDEILSDDAKKVEGSDYFLDKFEKRKLFYIDMSNKHKVNQKDK